MDGKVACVLERTHPEISVTHFAVTLQRRGPLSASHTYISGNPAVSFRAYMGGLQIIAAIADPRLGTFYRQGNSCALLFGQAHWKGDFTRYVSAKDLAGILESHRLRNDPQLRELAGNFCLLSYDSDTHTLWLGSDFWGTAAAYYGEAPDHFVVASRAGVVADQIGAAIDGISYLALMRDATLPSGRTLFDGVKRLTLGQALRLDGHSGVAEVTSLGPLYHEPLSCRFRESVERSIHVLVPAISLAASASDTMVDLTAGNDTRLTAAALMACPDLGHRVRFRVVGDPQDADVLGAQQIARLAGWKLEHYANDVRFGVDIGDLLPVAAAADGSSPLLAMANRLYAERQYWTSPSHLVGSTSGELFRNWMWQPELFRMGRTKRVNFSALMHHRIRRDRDTEVLRLSNGVLSIGDHDDQLLKPYKQLADMYPEALNTYKLDLMYVLQLQNRILWWPLTSRLTVEMPYLWSDVADVALRLPWAHKATRRLVTTIVETLAPQISMIPTDRGAPFRSLRLSTLLDYVSYLSRYTTEIARRHYLSSVPIPLNESRKLANTLPAEWAEAVSDRTLHDDQGLVNTVYEGSTSLSKTQRVEFLTILSLELLFRLYPKLQRRLAF
jgi:hypothetical protein